jgi:hypothetical protein
LLFGMRPSSHSPKVRTVGAFARSLVCIVLFLSHQFGERRAVLPFGLCPRKNAC